MSCLSVPPFAGAGRAALTSFGMGTSPERRSARDRVEAYHQQCLADLLVHVAAAVDQHRAKDSTSTLSTRSSTSTTGPPKSYGSSVGPAEEEHTSSSSPT
jgi:hypothetical protein